MKKTFLSILIIISFFGSLRIITVNAADPVIVGSEKETGGWFYEDLNTNTRSNSFSSLSKCEEYRTNNKLTLLTTNCYSVYKLLAPIGELKEAPKNIGDYVNTIFLIAIGLCGALAVVMIVIGGVQYMGDESIFGKTEAKSKIMSAILGLIIALGSYALLNTINPDLLGSKGVKINAVSAEIEDPPMQQESSDIPGEGIAVAECSSGIKKIQTSGGTMHVCREISNNVTAGINFAWTKEIKLSGAAFRSKADQIKLRQQNNCPDIMNSPSEDCKPPTAKPGTSRHESGKAIDFKCEGVSIQTTDNKCFLWLKENASTFGLYNYPKEPWHWSTDGH